jgi:hypothetical protein
MRESQGISALEAGGARSKMTKFPVNFPVYRESMSETGSTMSVSSATQINYFGASGDFAEKSRHSVR